MDQISITDFHYLFFVLPGFLIVWSFRYFTKSKKEGEFELLGLSFVWGLILILIIEAFYHIFYGVNYSNKTNDLLKNPYVFALLMFPISIVIGWIGRNISDFPFFKKIIRFLSLKEDKK